MPWIQLYAASLGVVFFFLEKLLQHGLFIKEMEVCIPFKWITVNLSLSEDNVLPAVMLVHCEDLIWRSGAQF